MIRRDGVYAFDGTKTVSINQLPEEAWRIVAGKPYDGSGELTPEMAYATVPWLYRACSLRAQSLAGMPWALLKGDTEVVISDDLSKLPKGLEWLAKMHGLLYRLELSLMLRGCGYWLRERNSVRTLGFRWAVPTSIDEQYSETDGLTGFKRSVGSQKIDLALDDVVYWWLPSVTSELGPGPSPVVSALVAAGLVSDVDLFASGFFKRGAVNLTLLSVEGNPSNIEMERLEKWWKRLVSGVKKAWESVAIRASVKPVVLGSPPKELAMPELTQQKREDIATALGIPYSIVFSNAANFATAEQDDLNFYTKTLLPEGEFIEQTANEQIFAPLGLDFRFQPLKLEIFQQMEAKKAYSLVASWQAGLIRRREWREQMGLEIDDGDNVWIWETQATKAKVDEQSDAELEGATNDNQTGVAMVEGQKAVGSDALPTPPARSVEFRQWERKALKAIERGRPAAVGFVSEAIAPDLQEAIRCALGTAKTVEQVKLAFDIAETFGEREVRALAASPFLRAVEMPYEDGRDAERNALERKHAKAIVKGLKAQLDAAIPEGTTEDELRAQGIEAAVMRAMEENQGLRDACYAMLVDGVLLGTETGRKQTEAMQGVGKKDALDFMPEVRQADVRLTDWTLVNADAREWARQYAGELVKGLDETTAKVLRQSLAEWIDDKLSYDDLLRQIGDAFGPERAERIAQTEITQAFARGTRLGLERGGVIEKMIWKTARDELVCDICRPLDGTVAQVIGGDFVHPGGEEGAARYEGQTFMLPPGHVRCRCWITGEV